MRLLRIALGRTSPMGAAKLPAVIGEGASGAASIVRAERWPAPGGCVGFIEPACPGSPLPLASTAWSFTGLTGYLAKDGSGFAGNEKGRLFSTYDQRLAPPPYQCGTKSQAENKRPFT